MIKASSKVKENGWDLRVLPNIEVALFFFLRLEGGFWALLVLVLEKKELDTEDVGALLTDNDLKSARKMSSARLSELVMLVWPKDSLFSEQIPSGERGRDNISMANMDS